MCEQPSTNIYGNFKRSHQQDKQGLKLNLDPLMLLKENLPHSIQKDKKRRKKRKKKDPKRQTEYF